MARLEYDSTVSSAPTKMSSSTSFGRASSSARTGGESVSGRVAAAIICKDISSSPSPISTRPIWPSVVLSRET